MAAPLPNGRSVRIRRVNPAPVDDLQISVWAYDRAGQGITEHTEGLRLWAVGAEPLTVRLIHGRGSDGGVGRLVVNMMGLLRDTDLEVSLHDADNRVTWSDTIRQGTRWMYEITFGVPAEWQPLLQWDAERSLSVITEDQGGVLVWVPLRAPEGGAGMRASSRFAHAVPEPHRAVRLPPGTWLTVDSPAGFTPPTGTVFIVLSSDMGSVRSLLALHRGDVLFTVQQDRDGAVAIRVRGANGLRDITRHAAGPVSGCLVMGVAYSLQQSTVSLVSMVTGDMAPRRLPAVDVASPPQSSTSPPQFLLGATEPTLSGAGSGVPVARTLDVHEVVLFPRVMDDSLLRAVHQHLTAKWVLDN
jgi:hypothetical protein